MIYYLFGPDDFSIGETVQKLLRAALPAETADLNLARLAAEDVTVDALRFACETTPFLADRRAVVVDRLFARLAARRGRAAKSPGRAAAATTAGDGQPKILDDLATYLPRVPANTLLIFVEADAPPKSGPLAKAFEQAQVKQQLFPTLAGAPLSRWIRDRAKLLGGQIDERAAQMLATFVGGDLRALSNEVQKLVTYAGPGRTVEAAQVQLLVGQVTESNVFDLVDAIGQGNRKTALVALHRLAQAGERPERVLAMVARQVRLLVQARDLLDRRAPSDVTARTLGLSPFPLRKVLEQARQFTLAGVRRMHRRTLDADVAIKTGQQEASLALELLVAELTSMRTAGSRRAS